MPPIPLITSVLFLAVAVLTIGWTILAEMHATFPVRQARVEPGWRFLDLPATPRTCPENGE